MEMLLAGTALIPIMISCEYCELDRTVYLIRSYIANRFFPPFTRSR